MSTPPVIPAISPSAKRVLWQRYLLFALLLLVLSIWVLNTAGFFSGFSVKNLTAGLSGLPSESQAESLVTAKIRQESDGRISLVSFTKTDGQEREIMGTKVYLLNFTTQIEFNEDCMWGPVAGSSWQGQFLTVPGLARDTLSQLGNLDKSPGRKGRQATVKGMAVFEKTEQGWKGEIAREGSIED